jgi:hypothetical protein
MLNVLVNLPEYRGRDARYPPRPSARAPAGAIHAPGCHLGHADNEADARSRTRSSAESTCNRLSVRRDHHLRVAGLVEVKHLPE